MSGQDDQRRAPARPAAEPDREPAAETMADPPAGPAETADIGDAGRGLPPIVWVPGLIAATLLLLALFGLN